MNNEKCWFYMIDEKTYGPTEQSELIQMLQSHRLHKFDFVWKSSMKNWTRIFDVEELQTSELLKKSEDCEKLLVKRRFPRFKCSIPSILHNQSILREAQVTSISQGGAEVTVKSPQFQIGEAILINLKISNGKTMNKLGWIKSKEFIPGKLHQNSEIKYIVSFEKEITQVQNII